VLLLSVPRVGSLPTDDPQLDAATAAYYRAEYDVALEIADTAPERDFSMHVVRVDSFRRLERCEDAIDAAHSAIEYAQTPDQRALATALLAGAQVAAGAIADAERTLARIRREKHIWSASTRGQIACVRAIAAYSAGNFGVAEEELLDAYADPDPVAKARAQQIQAFIFAARGDYVKQGTLLFHALRTLQRPNAVDVGLRASILHNLSVVIREVPFETDIAALRTELESLPWTSHLATARFNSHRYIGWRMVLEGGLHTTIGLRMLHLSGEYACSEMQRALALLDTAQVSIELREPCHADVHLQRAEELIRRVDWAHVLGDERLALLTAADLFIPTRLSAAAQYLDQFRALPAMHPWMALSHDDRSKAIEASVTGRLARHTGDTQSAIRALSFAYKVFHGAKYQWRAALAASELFTLTQQTIWWQRATAEVAPYPASWVAGRVGAVGLRGDRRFTALSRKERMIFDLLLEGLGNKDISERTGLSPRTIRNHSSSIYRKWNVRGQRELLHLSLDALAVSRSRVSVS
jgi:DNA-binding NarL/FixJ family response regulator